MLHQVTETSHAQKNPLVLHVRGITGRGGGPEKTILNSPRYLGALGYRSACAYLHGCNEAELSDLRRRAAAAEAELIALPDRGPFDLRLVRRLIALCRERQVTIWHGHDYKSNALGLLVRRFVPAMRLVSTAHGWVHFTPRTRWYHHIDKRCLRHYEQVYCVSDDLRAECLRVGLRPERCHLVPNAIDTESFRRASSVESAKQQAGFPAGRFLIGALGRLSPEKGFSQLIETVARLVAEGDDVALWIGGEGDQLAALEQQIAALDLADRVRLVGHVDDPAEFFQPLDLFVLSSLREGLPNVVLEAMATETPLVATRVAGVPRVITDREHGLLVPINDVAALTKGIRAMIHDAELRSRCARAARALVETQYSFRHRMGTIAGHYDRLLGHPDRVPGKGRA